MQFRPQQRSDSLKLNGFTLIEVLISLAILAVLAALAAPNFDGMIKRYRVNAVRDDLIASIQWARSEAVRRGIPVILVRTTGCKSAMVDADDWGCGWQAVADSNSNGAVDNGEPTVQVTTVPTGYVVKHTGLGSQTVISRWGQASVAGQNFVIAPPEGPIGSSTTTICLSSGGRIRKLVGQAACV